MVCELRDASLGRRIERSADHRDVDFHGVYILQQQGLRKSFRIVVGDSDIAFDMSHDVAAVTVGAARPDQKMVEGCAETVEVPVWGVEAVLLAVAREGFREGFGECCLGLAALDPGEETRFTLLLAQVHEAHESEFEQVLVDRHRAPRGRAFEALAGTLFQYDAGNPVQFLDIADGELEDYRSSHDRTTFDAEIERPP